MTGATTERATRTERWRASEIGTLIGLAVPLALTQLAQVALTTTDTVMMGSLGATTLAAGGLAIVVFNQLRTMGVGLVTAVGNQIAAAVARNESAASHDAVDTEVRDLVRSALLVATAAGVVGGFAMVGLGALLGFLGQEPVVVRATRGMLVALAPGLLPCLWFQVVRQYTVGMRRPQALLTITICSIGVNVVLNLSFIHGWGVVPALGLRGIGIATSLVYCLSFVALYAMARRDERAASVLSLRFWEASPATARRLLRLGVPIAGTYGSEAGFFFVVALVMGGFGAAELAAHTAVNQLVYIVFQITVGISHAASILVSGALATGAVRRARHLARLGLSVGAGTMAIAAVVYVVVPDLVLAPFFDAGGHARDIAGRLLLVAALLQLFDNAQNVSIGLLRGADDTAGGFRMTLIGYWLIGVPAVALLGRVIIPGPVGVWLGLATALACTAVLLLRRFLADLDLGVSGG